MVLSFEQSGRGPLDFGLPEVRELALAHGFTRPGAPADAPAAARVDLDAFFKAFDCKALSTFRKRFCAEPLAPPTAGAKAPAPAAMPTGFKTFEPDKPPACVPEPADKYEQLAASWEKGLKWRLVMRPGGAYIQPDDWYRLYAAVQQAASGDNVAERPMWADHGGIDFHGRACWDAWTALKGMSRDAAVAKFCRAYAEAHTAERFGVNFHGVAAGRMGGQGA